MLAHTSHASGGVLVWMRTNHSIDAGKFNEIRVLKSCRFPLLSVPRLRRRSRSKPVFVRFLTVLVASVAGQLGICITKNN